MIRIIDAGLGLQALRQAGYRSTGTAIAELVDNSIEAEADHIEIIAASEPVVSRQRRIDQITKIAVLDDGNGMDQDTLQACLSMGWGTRLNGREGLGRFGFGLKGASISQCTRVDVYSWVNRQAVFKAYLDIQEVQNEGLESLPEIQKEEIPDWVKGSFDKLIGDSGTLVVWSQFDQLSFKKPATLVKRLNDELCRVYRHFLDDDDDYGRKRNITVHHLALQNGELKNSWKLKANDPLYLLTPNNLPGHEDEATNELMEDFPFPVKYELADGSIGTSIVRIRTSIARPDIQNKHGSSHFGKHYGNNFGISFVRAGRELDLSDYGYCSLSEARHRWWGIEVRFEPVLDEYFGVTNNKQSVRAVKKLGQDAIDEMHDSSEYKDIMLLGLNKILDEQIKSLMSVITHRKEGSKTIKPGGGRGLFDKVNEEIKKQKDTKTLSGEESKEKSKEQKIRERITLLQQDDGNLTEEDARSIAEETLEYLIDITTHEWPGDIFLDRKTSGNGSAAVINRGTAFYKDFWQLLENADDSNGHRALQVIIMAMVRAEDELAVRYQGRVFSDFRQAWGRWVSLLIPLVTDNK